ncbi:tropomyosin-like [Tropilaelaps mercedesae]|uniref:Tropomyosin-like n=1 Tax=Tropilaelaps mercedesae TaxID=418985 RepID=A0A1V9XFA7_9ACAR|nr:tropomyosin-like [Tropilaelaps mercedesae]
MPLWIDTPALEMVFQPQATATTGRPPWPTLGRYLLPPYETEEITGETKKEARPLLRFPWYASADRCEVANVNFLQRLCDQMATAMTCSTGRAAPSPFVGVLLLLLVSRPRAFVVVASGAPTNPSGKMEAIKKKMQAMKLEKDNAADRADVAEQQSKEAVLRAEKSEEEVRGLQKKIQQIENELDQVQEQLATANNSLEEKDKGLAAVST